MSKLLNMLHGNKLKKELDESLLALDDAKSKLKDLEQENYKNTFKLYDVIIKMYDSVYKLLTKYNKDKSDTSSLYLAEDSDYIKELLRTKEFYKVLDGHEKIIDHINKLFSNLANNLNYQNCKNEYINIDIDIDIKRFKTKKYKSLFEDFVWENPEYLLEDQEKIYNELLEKDNIYYDAIKDSINYCKELKNKSKAYYKQLDEYFLIKRDDK